MILSSLQSTTTTSSSSSSQSSSSSDPPPASKDLERQKISARSLEDEKRSLAATDSSADTDLEDDEHALPPNYEVAIAIRTTA